MVDHSPSQFLIGNVLSFAPECMLLLALLYPFLIVQNRKLLSAFLLVFQ